MSANPATIPAAADWLGDWHQLRNDRMKGLVPASGQVSILLSGPAPASPRDAILTIPPSVDAVRMVPSAVVAGLDVIVWYRGSDIAVKFGTLRELVLRLIASRPRRLQLFDLDQAKAAFLVLGPSE